MSFLIIIIPAFGGFTFIVYIVFGPYLYTYHTFFYALKSVIFFILGQIDTEAMIRVNYVVSIGWSYIIYFF